MKIRLLLVFLNIASLCLVAQNEQPSVAEHSTQKTNSSSPNSDVAVLLKKIDSLRLHGNHKVVIETAHKALQLAKDKNDPKGAAHVLYDILMANKSLRNFEKCLYYFDKKDSILGFQTNSYETAQFTSLYGDACILQGKLEEGIKHLFTADSLFEEVKRPSMETKMRLAYAYSDYGKKDIANQYLFKAYDMAKEAKNAIFTSIFLYNIVLSNKNKLDEEPFIHYFNEYIQSKKNLGTEGHDLFLLSEKDSIPEEVLKELYLKYEGGNAAFRFIYSYLYLKKLLNIGEYKTAIDVGHKELTTLKEENEAYNKVKIHSLLARAYQQNQKFDSAYHQLFQYSSLKDTLFSKQQAQYIDSLNIRYETAQKEAQIQQQQFEIQQKTQQRNTFIGASFLLSLLGLIIYFFLQQRIRKNQIIANQKQQIQAQKISELEKTQRLLNLDAMITGQEQERKRIAKDLHDGLGGLLATVKVQFDAIQREMDKLAEMKVYQRANEMLDNACIEVRKIAHNMMPNALMKLGLVEAVEDMAEGIQANGSLQIEVQNMGFQSPLSETQQIMLYRIIQELLNNILKHAQAKNVIIQFAEYERELSITVEDDGKGFDVKAMKVKEGFGLKSIESRTNYLKGKWEVDSDMGVGTTTIITVPIG